MKILFQFKWKKVHWQYLREDFFIKVWKIVPKIVDMLILGT